MNRTARQYLDDERGVLAYLKTRFPLYHDSNIFFRDIQYGIQSLLADRGVRVRYPEAEWLAADLTERLVRAKVLHRLDRQTWRVQDPEFKTPQVQKPAAAGKAAATAGPPAAPAQAFPRPAGPAAATPAGGS